MAKAVAIAVICVLAIATLAHCHPVRKFNVEGQVYCDPCRIEFQTKLSKPIAGATVRLGCRNSESEKNVTYTVEGVTDNAGRYTLSVEGNHEDDICDVAAIKSPLDDCNVPFQSFEKARISLTENNGVSGDVRLANPIGFMTKHPASECGKILHDLDLFSVD